MHRLASAAGSVFVCTWKKKKRKSDGSINPEGCTTRTHIHGWIHHKSNVAKVPKVLCKRFSIHTRRVEWCPDDFLRFSIIFTGPGSNSGRKQHETDAFLTVCTVTS